MVYTKGTERKRRKRFKSLTERAVVAKPTGKACTTLRVQVEHAALRAVGQEFRHATIDVGAINTRPACLTQALGPVDARAMVTTARISAVWLVAFGALEANATLALALHALAVSTAVGLTFR